MNLPPEILEVSGGCYRGIDPLGEVWQPIWNDIIDYFGNRIRFYPNDILQLVDIIVQKK